MGILGVTCMRDDGPYMAEWIAHHLAAGFDRMLIFSHDCSDGSDTLLDALSADARIAHVRFTPEGKKTVQWQALKLIQSHEWYQNADWALFFDCDEFLCAPDPLPRMIEAFQTTGACDAIALPWRLYGANGQERRSADLTPERFLRAAPFDLHFPLGHLFKTLHRPTAFRQPGVHRPRAKKSKPARWRGPDGRPLPGAFATADAAITLYATGTGQSKMWLNHYSLRSTEEFLVKRDRGLPNHVDREIDLKYWVERNWNTEDAPEILPMMAQTHACLDTLLSLPDVSRLHAACEAHHTAKYETLIGQLDILRLAFRLGLVPDSIPPTAQAGHAFVAAQQAIFRSAE